LEKGLEDKFEEEENNANLEHSSKNENEKEISDNENQKEDDKHFNININEEIMYKKEKINELSRNKFSNNYNMTDNISNTLAPLKTKIGYTINNTEEENLNNNEDKNNNNIITLKENPKYNNFKKEQEKNQFSYQTVLNNYKKLIKTKKVEEIKEKHKKKIKLSPSELNLRSKFSVAVYRFLFALVSKVEIRMDNSENINLLKNSYKNNCISKLFKEISNKIIDLKRKDKFLQRQSVQEKIERISLSKEESLKNKKDYHDEENKIIFFIKPYVSFHLDEETKENFLLNVDRSSAKMKYRSLVIFADYAIFEMMYNMKFVNKYSFFVKLSKMKFRYLQIINYVFIIVENSLLM